MKYTLIICTFFVAVHAGPKCVVENFTPEDIQTRCCATKQKCCNTPQQEPTKFEVKAVIEKCSKQAVRSNKHAHIKSKNINTLDHNRSDRRVRTPQVTQINCNLKIVLTVKINNRGLTNTKNQYIIIDHVYDEQTEQKQRLLRPYVLRINQQMVLQKYDLNFEHLVNSEAQEKIYNKETPDYKGCCTNPKGHPTCKVMKYKDEVIPFSTGFCCSCDKAKNKMMEDADTQGSDLKAGSCSIPLNNQYRMWKPNQEVNASSNNEPSPLRLQQRNYLDTFYKGRSGLETSVKVHVHHHEDDADLEGNKTCERPVYQTRGGQDCNDLATPPDVNKVTYHESTHCLEFSDLWYSVYRIGKPRIDHSLTLEVFQKHEEACGNTHWKDITQATPINVGSENLNKQLNMDATLSVTYESISCDSLMFSLNPETEKLLIPDPNADPESIELKGGPNFYLVVEKNKISRGGKTCDVSGVGYEAFVKQPNRCEKPPGTCLGNQPKELFENDLVAEGNGKKGCYFLKNYGVLTAEPIQENPENPNNKTLSMHFLDLHTSVLNIELTADDNVMIKPEALVMITEVYVEATSPSKAVVTAKLTNSGLLSGIFYVGLTQCSSELPAHINTLVTKPALIAPQHQHIYNMDICYDFPKRSVYHCTLQAINAKDEVLAIRRIRIQTGDRCLCTWYCQCACYKTDGGLKCSLLSLDAYLAAGFQGGFPTSLHVVRYTFLDDMISTMLYIILFLCLLLLIMGLVKGLLGIFVNINIGLWGMDIILDLPKPISRYYESSLRQRKVVYNIYGWPIHPDTKERVRNTSVSTEFCLNVVFFIIFPFSVCCIVIKKIFSSPYGTKHDYVTQTNSGDFNKKN